MVNKLQVLSNNGYGGAITVWRACCSEHRHPLLVLLRNMEASSIYIVAPAMDMVLWWITMLMVIIVGFFLMGFWAWVDPFLTHKVS